MEEKMEVKTTRKTLKIIGKETYINRNSGEIVEMNVCEISEKDANFHKLWLGHIIQALEVFGYKKLKILTYVMENLNKDNVFIGTYDSIAMKIEVSKGTVVETMKALKEANFLKYVQSGVYQVNPDVIFKGGKTDRLDVLLRYKNLEKSEENKDIKQEKSKTKTAEEQASFEKLPYNEKLAFCIDEMGMGYAQAVEHLEVTGLGKQKRKKAV